MGARQTDMLARIVMHGLAGPVKVSGRTYNLAMPPLPQLTDEDIAGVLTYIRREWEHTASAVETKAVTENPRPRKRPDDDVDGDGVEEPWEEEVRAGAPEGEGGREVTHCRL
jgi:hypothetical protein